MRKYIREAQITYRRAAELPEAVRRSVRSSRDAVAVIRDLIGRRMTESFLVLAMSAKMEIIGYHEVARGTVAACPVNPADVLRYPIIVGAHCIIIAHNHPSGDPSPSSDDLDITKKLLAASELLGITLTDHIIVTDDNYTSFLDSGRLVR